tara:strand:- start:362 stop:1021 length:660 start_codon:yes stop_codon:yes gene_type:complete
MEVVMTKKKEKPVMTTEDLKKLREHIMGIYELEAKYNTPLMHNYAWREWMQLLDAKPHFKGLRLLPGTHGADAESDSHSKIEFKSCKTKLLQKSGKYSQTAIFQFDKQDKPQRRTETLEYDGFVFSGIGPSADVVWSVLGVSDKAVAGVRAVLKRKQQGFVKLMNEVYSGKGKESRDTINISYDDLLNIADAVYRINGVDVTKAVFKTHFNPIDKKGKK